MGLELVELVMEIEDTFRISIPEKDLPEISTVGQLSDCIERIVSREREEPCLTAATFYELRRVLTALRGLDRSQLRPSTTLRKAIPALSRRRTWRRLQRALAWEMPALEHPPLILKINLLLAIVAGGAIAIGVTMPGFRPALPLGSAIATAFVLFLVAGGLVLVAGYWVTKPIAAIWPAKLHTLGDLTRAVVAKNYGVLGGRQAQWNPEEVWKTVQAITAEVLAVDVEQVTREARFAEDLGAG